MTKKTSEINPQRSEKYRYLDQLNYVPKFIIISSLCGVLAAVGLIIGALALYISAQANAKVDYELKAYSEELTINKNRMTLQNVYLQELYFLLKEHDIDPPPLPEE